jgi:hypothetical protein
MSKRVTSRLAKKKKKELTKQSIVLILFSVILGSIFIFLILPNAVRFFFDFLDQETNLTPTDNIPPQPPIVAAPPQATTEAKIKLNGYGEVQAQVILKVNNQQQDKATINDEGEFSIEANLKEGENQIQVYSVDDAGNESVVRSFQVIKDTQNPPIKIGNPQDGESFELKENQTITIQGETEPRSKVYINDHLVYANSKGEFDYRLRLNEGKNDIRIRVVDIAGNSSEHKLSVSYRD